MFSIKIQLPWKETIPLRVQKNWKISTLKNLIAEMKNWENDRITLYLDNQVLKDNTKLESKEIEEGEILNMTYRGVAKMQIFVRTLQGATATFNIPVNSTHKDIKEQLKDRFGIPVDQQRLIYGGKEIIKDNLLLTEYGVTNNSTLHLVLRLRGGC
ncbi:polyubiquitin-like [Anaeramoeba flamelloides]|uniref:Polyubiquitin-like n=1 Tax=Anaeramoeba flamelloides TaxID=1746091 RepID=A0ABQ8XDF9_9EUKA|nr:polyubiquitin-like [Anaeramoeba flamelloides]